MSELRVGLGIDLHAWADDRTLMLGGVEFPGEPGLLGHSDGDAVCHALADALLGAAGLGDIGELFPDTDPAFEGLAGTDLLGRVVNVLADHALEPATCDVTVLAERPHIASRRNEMRVALSAVLLVETDAVSVKATRPEGLGLSGDGVGCFAVATVHARAT